MTNDILNLMISYNGKDVRRINHAIKVFTFAQNIALNEKCDNNTQKIIEYASILHDIGIHKAEEKYKSTAGEYQEKEGPGIANELLKELTIDEDIKNRVFYIIGNHHTYNKIDRIDFQIVVESDFLVNIFEDNINKDAIESIKKKIFKTKTGLLLLESMYL